jgi:hypothetical protein
VNQSAAITSASGTTFTVGAAGSFTVTATGSPAPTLSESGALPSGVGFNPGTGLLSGTPGAGTAGTYSITFTAHNGVGSDATQSFTLTVVQAVFLNGYSYSRAITISHTKVPNTDQTNFPVLISGTYSYLATKGNGGNVTSANGYDIIFTADAAGTTPLAFEQDSYSASTGAINYWVKVPTLSHTTDTVSYLFYGNASVTTDPSNKTAVWDSNYQGVWHLEDNAANTTVKDSTSNSNNGTSAANTSSKTTAGEIGAGLSFNGSSDDISTSLLSSKVFTWEAWVNAGAMSSSRYDTVMDVGSPSYMLMQLSNGAGSF